MHGWLGRENQLQTWKILVLPTKGIIIEGGGEYPTSLYRGHDL